MKQWSVTNNAQVKVLIWEGTQIDKALIESEENMRRQLKNLLETGGYDYFLVKYNLIDWDYFRIFVRTTEKFRVEIYNLRKKCVFLRSAE